MNIDSIYKTFKDKCEETITYITDELRQIRTGKASPSLVDGIEITTYGGTTTLKLRDLASITSDGATSILIDPFDGSTTQDIEKAIHTSPLALSPRVEGKLIRIIIPPLTEEQRQKFLKLASEKIEQGKVQIRNHRDHARKSIKSLLDEKSITEDDKFRAEKEIDTMTKTATDRLDDVKKKKSDEIMSV